MGARGQGGLTAFVPNGDSRKDTATILLGTAEEYGLNPRSVRATQGGFYISEELADLLGEDDEGMDYSEPEGDEQKDSDEDSTKTSGNRAAKKTDSDKE